MPIEFTRDEEFTMSASSSRHKSNASVTPVECPGTIVADFEALMDFVASGVRSNGKYHLLPMARLNELEEGQSIPFVYDFGASWQFTVKLEKIKPPDPEITRPIIVESRGEAPKEYDNEW